MASSDETKEEARDCLYELYEYALRLEPKPDRPEPTTAKIRMINSARGFITIKMKKRKNLRKFRHMLKMREIARSMGKKKIHDLHSNEKNSSNDLLFGQDFPKEDDEWELNMPKTKRVKKENHDEDEIVQIISTKKNNRAKKKKSIAEETFTP